MSAHVIVALVEAKEGYEAVLVQAQRELVEMARHQPGCLSYELHESLEQPGTVVFFEQWVDRASWEHHMRSPLMDAFRASAGRWIENFKLLHLRQIA
ncbi:putative quinol monooxygenase [Burkholderia ambifaria]|jgi:quinol monooxygenase YgiN|uniref:Antibiotic biosynthesis monooxygenase n=1 Tax=Burkholderia ambifaria TaxID=152480 RepID=A0AA41E2Y2_9BURK|nr:putative quinol monooxygenase [Burkholderia ambifaria]MBR8127410.1 antibiotic biosynthesis monooxygenase [Burkholderia ambifaria]PRD95969.1 antibiotic biosynthesis monooxygenase [Burkholderia ambifaria]UEP51492.1 antibiotic biosynthesis monooxygenase [Burkholderia ambifaria]